MKYPSFEDLAKAIRDSARLKRDQRIDPDTQFCRDLGISGQDGVNLFKAIEGRYEILFSSDLYNRIESSRSILRDDPDESPVIQSLFRERFDDDPFTVGQLYRIVLQELRPASDHPQTDRRTS